MSFRAEYWYAYLRSHPDVPRRFYRIRPDTRGAVVVDAKDYMALRAATGGLPQPQIDGYWSGDGTYWAFDFYTCEFVQTDAKK